MATAHNAIEEALPELGHADANAAHELLENMESWLGDVIGTADTYTSGMNAFLP